MVCDGSPMASARVQPNSRSAPAFHSVMVPRCPVRSARRQRIRPLGGQSTQISPRCSKSPASARVANRQRSFRFPAARSARAAQVCGRVCAPIRTSPSLREGLRPSQTASGLSAPDSIGLLWHVRRPDAERQLDGPYPDPVAILQACLSFHRRASKQRAVGAGQIVEHRIRRGADDPNPGMVTRHAGGIQPDMAIRVAPDDVLTGREQERSIVPDQPVSRRPGREGRRRILGVGRRLHKTRIRSGGPSECTAIAAACPRGRAGSRR